MLQRQIVVDCAGKAIFRERILWPATARLDWLVEAAKKTRGAGAKFRRTDNGKKISLEAVPATPARHRVGIVEGRGLKEHETIAGMGVLVHLRLFSAAQLGQPLDPFPKLQIK